MSNELSPPLSTTLSTPAETILVVDDESDLVNLVRYNLLKSGFRVISALDGTSALHLIYSEHPDLVILDLMLPDCSGVEICRKIKADPTVCDIPVLMLTARSAEADRITGFEAGAEDYVLKPFSPKELVLRVKAMLGRLHKTADPVAKAKAKKKLSVGPLTIDVDAHRVWVSQPTSTDSQEVLLTLIEFKLLLAMAHSPNRVKTREALLSDVWQEDSDDIMDRAVDTNMKRLRAKLGEARDCIQTVRGVGYRLVDQS
jgi:two-component system, OmpR family, phosphate regulon response regulator PhoB